MKKLSIIIPYRDREQHLKEFVEKVPVFLKGSNIEYDIIVVEQSSDGLFNRGKLINIGVLLSDADYFALHDVDMLPLEVDYSYVETPTHIAARVSDFNYQLPYEGYFGGVSLVNRDDYYKINGFNNEYWGWGAEDDDLLIRIVKSGLKPQRKNCKFICLPHEKVGAKNPNYNNNLKLLTEFAGSTDGAVFSGVKDCKYELLDESKIANNFNIEIKKYKVKI